MKLNMPLVTLLTGAALGVGVLVASMLSPSTSSAATSPAGGYGAASPASAATPSATATAPATTPATTRATTPATTQATTPATAYATTPATAPATATATAPATAPVAPASASQASVPPKADYVGRVDGGGAAVAISVHGDKAVAYICNGHAVAAWFRGRAVAGKLDLVGKHGARLSVDYRKEKTAGSIVADGTRYTFSAPVVRTVRAVSSGHRPPGLYEATATVDGTSIKAGWIVLPDGSQVGSVEYDPGSAVPPTAQAPVLDLATGTASYDGVTLVASLITGITGSGF